MTAPAEPASLAEQAQPAAGNGKPGFKGALWECLALVAIAALAWPAVRMLFWPGYISTYDGVWHLMRMVEVDELLHQGIWYPRWFPDFGLGHGYPIFNFFPPLSYLLTELPGLVLGDLPLAVQVSMAASVAVSGWGMYLLARTCYAGRPASVVAAFFYMYFPLHLENVYSRGALPELWAIAWLPWLAWSFVQASRTGGFAQIARAGLFVAAAITTHNFDSLIALPIAALWGLALGPRTRRSMTSVAASGVLGLCVAAGYWLPSVGEASLTNVRNLRIDTVTLFRPSELVRSEFFAVYGQTYRLVWPEAAVLFGLAVVVGLGAILRPRARPGAAVALGSLALLLLSLTPAARSFWQNVPLVNYVQFPWRMLIFIGFTMAGMSALVGAWHRLAWLAVAPFGVLIAYVSLGHVPMDRFALAPVLDARTIQTQEFGTEADGGTTESEYLPKTTSYDVVKLNSGRLVTPDDSALPPVQVRNVSNAGTTWTVDLTAERDSSIRLQPFFFPGWRAKVDGKAVPVRPATLAGFLEVPVPAGDHHLEASYSGTPLEGLSGILSGAALAVVGVMLIARSKRVTLTLLLIGGSGWLVFALPHAAAADIAPTPWALSPSQQMVAARAPRIDARGIELDLFWLFTQPRETPFNFVLRNIDGAEVRRWSSAEASSLPLDYLAVNELLLRRYTLTGADSIPAGLYGLTMESDAERFSLGSLRLSASTVAARGLDVPFEDVARLVSYRVDRLDPFPGVRVANRASPADSAASPGNFIMTSLTWLPLQHIDHNFVAFVHLLDANGRTWASHDNDPDGTLQATSSWIPGKPVQDHYIMKLPDDAPPGMYHFEVGMYRLTSDYTFLHAFGRDNSVLFGTLKIRPAVLPPLPTSWVAAWTEPIVMVGWKQERRGNDVAFTFDWAATGNVPSNYTLFVHLTDVSGKPLAQADSPPQQGQFLTSLWEAGDRISDTHIIPSPTSGRYQLQIGWYRADTGERLMLKDGAGDSLNLGDVSVD